MQQVFISAWPSSDRLRKGLYIQRNTCMQMNIRISAAAIIFLLLKSVIKNSARHLLWVSVPEHKDAAIKAGADIYVASVAKQQVLIMQPGYYR